MKRNDRRTDPKVKEILAKYARISSTGTPIRCSQTFYERTMRERYNNLIGIQEKIIYDSWEKAESALKEFTELNGNRPGQIYKCQRSKHGHCHITTAYAK